MKTFTKSENELKLVPVRRCGSLEPKVHPKLQRFARLQRQRKRPRKLKGRIVKI